MRACGVGLAILLGWLTDAALAQKIGKPAPEFELESTEAGREKLTLASLKGRIVVLVFWRSTDSASIDLLPVLNELHSKYRKEGVAIVAITPEERGVAESVARGKEVQFDVGYGGSAPETYHVPSYPHAFLIDPRGIVVWRGHPGDDLEERIKDQVRRAPSGASVAQLRGRLERAEKLRTEKQYGRAYTIAHDVADLAEREGDIQEAARTLMARLEEDARAWLAEARQARLGGDEREAARIAAEVSIRFAGTSVADEAQRELAELRAGAQTRELVKPALENARGALRNDEAAEMEARRRYPDALEVYREVAEKYEGTLAAKQAREAIERIRSDPQIREQMKTWRAEEQAQRWLDLGDRFARVEMPDLARSYYQKVIDQNPRSPAAARARQRLLKLPAASASRPTTRAADEGAGGGERRPGRGP